MKVIKTAIEGVLILEPKVFGDERGFFLESFNQKVFDTALGHHVGPPCGVRAGQPITVRTRRVAWPAFPAATS
jgi:dTDP-4-dehydrorhamnose 3,5-epimerase-like enzyme